jgi:hypothetical protein
MQVDTKHYTLALDDRTGALRSLRDAGQPARELLGPLQARLPLFLIQYLDAERRFHELSSDQARSCTCEREDGTDGALLRLAFTGVAGLDLDAQVIIRCPRDQQLSYWSLSLVQRAPILVANVQFPLVVVPYRFEAQRPANLLVPLHVGELRRDPRPEDLQPDYPDAWRFVEDFGHAGHYPGTTFAQFLAYYDDLLGVYIGCHDASGGVKIIKPVHRVDSLRLGIAHVTGWEQPGEEHHLGYEVALGPFRGDWYDAADIYRAWYEQEANTQPPLHQRQDVPAWLLDSPLHIILRIQGELDAGPAAPHPEFVPYENALPLLDRLAERVDAPVTPIIMSWERPGPWVYPDSFPVAGGDDSLRAFTAAARTRNWHIGTYCNGTRWVLGHRWTGYDGDTYYREHDGQRSVCRLPDGAPWRESWDAAWRPSYMSCMAATQTLEIAQSYVQHLLDLGLDWIQFLDQNVGAATFPCYGREHGHPAAPGRWMSEAMNALLARIEAQATATDREIVFSVEDAPNDHFRPHFPICDIRPDHGGSRFVPLYHYLFHAYILTQGAFAIAPDPNWMQIKTAYSFVLGDLLTAIMGPGGRLMAWCGRPWSRWDTPAGDQEGILALLRRAIALRRGVGRDYLVFGRLLRPLTVEGIRPVTWTCEARVTTIPAVAHAHWQAPDGRTALALANWTAEAQTITLLGDAASTPATVHLRGERDEETWLAPAQRRQLTLPPLSAALLEYDEDTVSAAITAAS